jgi:ABC-type Fe3+/spermidine/putrescine transport system ATPase subunit
MRIELVNVHKRYGDVSVVVDLSLSLASGQVTALLGPSGCGKTTTLRMIAGLERASAGRVVLGDRVVDDAGAVFVPPEQRGLGMVFQSYALWPHKSVLENVAYPLTLRGLARDVVAARAKAALDSVRLSELAARAPHQLSGGQQQRVAVARALVGDGEKAPPILLLDEPLANLDARLREDMRAELAHIAKSSGATVVAVTHDQQEAFALADHVVVLERGRLAQQGTPEELYLRPASAFVGAFAGPMAFLPATRADNGDVVVAGAHVAAAVVGDAAPALSLGLRPEWLVPCDDARSGALVVAVVQRLFLGREHELLVETHEGGHRLTLRTPSTSAAPSPGSVLALTVTRACAFAA